MIKYTRKKLSNGLIVLCNTDNSTPFVSVNILYKVGSRNENPTKTGFAHLFEHLMFGGSKNAPDFDRHVQLAGGDSNAFTTNDYTNYYISIPAENIETALWLESDRMSNLIFSQEALDVQKNVVTEEFKQRYLNQPYGDIWLKLKPLAYKVHPYMWPTIGKSVSHIADATLDDVESFFKKYYTPDNAILSISGNISTQKANDLAEKWFGDIKPCSINRDVVPVEPTQTEARELIIPSMNVPSDAIYKVYHMGPRMSEEFYCCDIITDLLSSGQSSRLYVNLIKNGKIFSGIDACVSGDVDPGLVIFSGKLLNGVDIKDANDAICNEIEKFITSEISDREMSKVVNKMESRISFGEINYQNRSSNLALFEMLGDADLVNSEAKMYTNINKERLINCAKKIFAPTNCSTLLYLKK